MNVGHPAGASFPVRKETFVEVIGYGGAAAAVAGAVTWFTRRTDLSDAAALSITLVVSAVLVVAGSAIGDYPSDAYQRMRSVLWFASVESFAFASGIFLSNIVDLGPKSAVTLSGVISAAFAAVLWLLVRRSLQQIAFFLTVVGTITALATPSSIVSTSDLNDPLIVLWLCGVAWFVAGTAEIVRPHRTARVLGAVVALIATLEMFAPSFSLALTLTGLTSLVLLVVGDWKGDRAVAGLGIVGILIAAAVGVGRAAVDSNGAAVAAIVVGLLLLGGAIGAIRMDGSRDVPSMPGEPPAPPPPPAY